MPVHFCDRAGPTCGPMMPTEIRPLASATTIGSIQSELIPGIQTGRLLGRIDCSDELIARTNPADLCGLPKSTMIPGYAVHVRPRQTNKTVRTINCTPDRDSALSRWLIARAIEVNCDVLRLQRLKPMPVDFPTRPMPNLDRSEGTCDAS